MARLIASGQRRPAVSWFSQPLLVLPHLSDLSLECPRAPSFFLFFSSYNRLPLMPSHNFMTLITLYADTFHIYISSPDLSQLLQTWISIYSTSLFGDSHREHAQDRISRPLPDPAFPMSVNDYCAFIVALAQILSFILDSSFPHTHIHFRMFYWL